MITCQVCDSTRLRNKGNRINSKGEFRRYKCRDCGTQFQVPLGLLNSPAKVESNDPPKVRLITPSKSFNEEYPGKKGIVVTSCLNDTPINEAFFGALEKYCDDRGFALAVIPLKYLNPSAMNMASDVTWPKVIAPYMIRHTIKFGEQFKIIGDCNIQATATHPLTGIDGLCEGMTTVVGHPVLQMKTVPVNQWNDPIILSSTGCISVKTQYSATKAGYRASFHHCFSAVVIELDNDVFHMRHLLADGQGGFADLDRYWTAEGSESTEVDAIVFGDEHVIFGDDVVYNASFFDKKSMVNVLKPKYMIRHDVFDAISCGKHDVNNFFNRFKKHQKEYRSVEHELKETFDHLVASTPETSVTMVVNSNHDDHLDQWLSSFGDPKNDYVNALIYHQLMYLRLKAITEGDTRTAFRLYGEEVYGLPENVKFCPDGFALHDIVLSAHGDRGPNGSRGSLHNLSKIGERSVIGHSHSPGILGGTFQVGLSGIKNMDYTKGSPSSWLHTHCIIHKNGKRQLVNVIKGRWRAK